MSVVQFPDFKRRHRGTANATYCHWLRALTQGCVALMPTHIDALAWMERALPAEQATPGNGNTLWVAEWRAASGEDGLGAHPQQGLAAEAPRVSQPAVALTAAAAIEAARALEGAPVLFLGAVPQLADESGLPLLPQAAAEECYFVQNPQQQLETSGTTEEGLKVRRARREAGAAAAAASAGAAADGGGGASTAAAAAADDGAAETEPAAATSRRRWRYGGGSIRSSSRWGWGRRGSPRCEKTILASQFSPAHDAPLPVSCLQTFTIEHAEQMTKVDHHAAAAGQTQIVRRRPGCGQGAGSCNLQRQSSGVAAGAQCAATPPCAGALGRLPWAERRFVLTD